MRSGSISWSVWRTSSSRTRLARGLRTHEILAADPAAVVRLPSYPDDMPSRNEPCPCGSGRKYKRCCLVQLDVVARELRERDAFLGDLTAWLRAEHAQKLEESGSHTTLIRMLRGVSGRGMSMVWALNDYLPADGGPTLMERYIARPGLGPSDKAIARGLAEARLDVYRVRSVAPGVCLELESLSDDTSVGVAWRDGLEHFRIAEILVARVVDATTAPTLWGPGARFPADGERRWRARLAALPADPAQTALTILGFHPDDAAEPLPDGVDLHTMTWSIEDDEGVLKAIEDDDLWERLGEARAARPRRGRRAGGGGRDRGRPPDHPRAGHHPPQRGPRHPARDRVPSWSQPGRADCAAARVPSSGVSARAGPRSLRAAVRASVGTRARDHRAKGRYGGPSIPEAPLRDADRRVGRGTDGRRAAGGRLSRGRSSR